MTKVATKPMTREELVDAFALAYAANKEAKRRYDALLKQLKALQANEPELMGDAYAVSFTTSERTGLDTAQIRAHLGKALARFEKTTFVQNVTVRKLVTDSKG